MKACDSEEFWSNTGPSVNLDDSCEKTRYKYDDIKKFSQRSSKPAPAAPIAPAPKSYQSTEPLSFSIQADCDLENPELCCYTCQKIIVDHDTCKYEGNKVFMNEICWQHWLNKMIESDQINIAQLCSLASKRYYLDRVTETCNGQLILRVILALKSDMPQFEFGTLLYDNQMACNHYISFLKETRQTDDKLLRCKYQLEEAMSTLRELFNDNSKVNAATVNQFITQLSEFRDERLLNLNMPLQCEMIKEYVCLLDWQFRNNKEFINAPLIETLISNNVSYEAIKDLSKARYLKDTFKITSEEFVWTSIKSIVDENRVADIDSVFNHKLMGNKADVPFSRVVAYLIFLNKTPDEIKMKCLLKITDVDELVYCANMWKLLPSFVEYCKKNKENSLLKKIQQASQGHKK